jgi:hypothetical protein
MKFIRFEQSTGEMKVPGEGPVPFLVDGTIGVTCVRLSDQDLANIVANDNRVYILSPLTPGGQPVYVKPMSISPFIKLQKDENKS